MSDKTHKKGGVILQAPRCHGCPVNKLGALTENSSIQHFVLTYTYIMYLYILTCRPYNVSSSKLFVMIIAWNY